MTVGELRKMLADNELENDTPIIIIDVYTGAFVKEFEIKNNDYWNLEINIDTDSSK